MTITFHSADLTRKIELSADGGIEYDEIPPDSSTATKLQLSIFAPITNLRVTGAIADKLYIAN
ncbi:MAG: hypothetical protein WC967_15555 [Balneolaceae bacterium]